MPGTWIRQQILPARMTTITDADREPGSPSAPRRAVSPVPGGRLDSFCEYSRGRPTLPEPDNVALSATVSAWRPREPNLGDQVLPALVLGGPLL